MALQDIMKEMDRLIQAVTKDLEKAGRYNKAASQRVRTNTIRLEKVAKKYRKESIKEEKSEGFKKKKATSRKPTKKRVVVKKKMIKKKAKKR